MATRQTKQLKETAAEVLASIPSWTWDLMDEEQRDDLMLNRIFPRYMKTTTDGIQLGPTFWAGAVGATYSAIESRVKRLRASQKAGDGDAASTETDSKKAAFRHARNELRKATPESARKIAADLPAEQIEVVIEALQETAIDRARAEVKEHDTTPTADDLMGGEQFDPSESWADKLIMRVGKNTRELSSHVDRWGLVIASLGEETGLEYLEKSEREIAGVRVALQERLRDAHLDPIKVSS